MRVDILIFKKSFMKAFKKLDMKIQREFKIRKDILVINPNDSLLHTHPLRGEWKGYWSINISGDIRAIFRIQKNIAIFTDIGTHSELYE